MAETASSVLAPWANFFVMTGSSAGALTGLMFVVITLTNGERRTVHAGLSAFSTPIVVHFGAALLFSAILNAPWHSLSGPAALLGFAGAGGTVYVFRVIARTRRLTIYVPDAEDWIWYTILPCIAYLATLAGAIMLLKAPENALFVLAGSVALLIVIGVRNAWDIVTYIAIGGPNEPPSTP